MGLFGNSKNQEDYVYEGLAMLQQNKPKVATNISNKNLILSLSLLLVLSSKGVTR